MAAPLIAAQLGGSRLCGDPGRPARPSPHIVGTRHLSADELLANGPKGGRGSPQDRRHQQINESQQRLAHATARAEDQAERLHEVMTAEREKAEVGTAVWSEAQGRLGTVILDRVRQRFLGTNAAHPRSDLRADHLQKLHADLAWADGLSPHCNEQTQSELERLKGNALAMQAVARAQELRQESAACAAAEAAAEQVLASSRGLSQANQQGAADKAAVEANQRFLAVAEERGRIVGEAIEMLRHWKQNSEVAFQLTSVLLAMAETGGDDFVQEMDRRGLGFLTSTVADIWAGRAEVAKVALRLLGTVSIEHLVRHLDEVVATEGKIVFLGLEALNKLTSGNMEQVDEAVRHGAREMLDEVDVNWSDSRMISLLSLNIRRRLRKSQVESLREKKEVQLADEEVVKLRGCFEHMDQDNSGSIDAKELSHALKLVGMKANRLEIQEAITEVDVDGSGLIEWPEFLWLMSRFGKNQTIEALFTEERLAELREVFNTFDQNGDGTLAVKEISLALRSVGLSLSDFELRAIIGEFDANESGAIDWLEFLFLMSRKAVDPENQHQLAFQFFDEDRSGFIDKQEFVDRMTQLSDEFTIEELDQMVFEAKFENEDLDIITYKEFVKLMMRP